MTEMASVENEFINYKRQDYTTIGAPWATYESWMSMPPAIPRNLLTRDIKGANPTPEKDTPDPTCLLKMFPDIWMVAPVNKKLKPSRNMVTDRCTNPLNPDYKLCSGPSIIPCGADFFSNRVTDGLNTSDIPGARAESFYKNPARTCPDGECVRLKGSYPAKRTFVRGGRVFGGSLDLFDVDIGKKTYGFPNRHPQSSPLEPLYPTEPRETPDMKYKRLKMFRLPPHKQKWNVAERLLDGLYWKAEQIPHDCRRFGTRIDGNMVSYDDFRRTLERFGLFFTDPEYTRLIKYADIAGDGAVKYENFSRALKHCDGLELDVPRPLGIDNGVLGSPSCLGQGVAVVEELPPAGKKQVKWSQMEQVYNVFTGDTMPYHTEGINESLQRGYMQYSYPEMLASLFEEDRRKRLYFPAAYRSLSTVALEESKKAKPPVEGPTCKQAPKVALEVVVPASVSPNQVPITDLIPDATATAKEFAVENATPEARKLSKNIIGKTIPVNNSRGDEVVWKPVPSAPRTQRPVTFKARLAGEKRSKDIEDVRSLIV